jgi:hypothetical protein
MANFPAAKSPAPPAQGANQETDNKYTSLYAFLQTKPLNYAYLGTDSWPKKAQP